MKNIIRCILVVLFVVMGIAAVACPSKAQLPEGAIVVDGFNRGAVSAAYSQEKNLTLHGSASAETIEIGTVIKLTEKGWAEYLPPAKLNTGAGTFSFWLKPLWKEGDINSKPLVSLRWDDTKNSYLSISQGWWEPTGTGRLYFILSNEDYVHCSLPYKFVPGYWSMITVSWQNGNDGYCKIFVDGEMVTEIRKSFSATRYSRDPIYFGSDRGATDQRGRNSEALIGAVTIYNRTLSNQEVTQVYKSQLKDTVAATEKKWKWLDDGLKLPAKSNRTKDGTLLETRAIFDEDIRWATSREETDKILERIKRAGFNVYIPCVWHGKGTYFASSKARPDQRLMRRIDSGDDPLAYLIKRAHALGIEVHPWFTVVNRETDEYTNFFDDGTPKQAFNVHNGEFRQFIVDMMIDVVRRYEVDGVNLDYIRAMGICTSDPCRQDYEKHSRHGFWSDYALRLVNGDARNRLQQWQDDAITQIVEPLSAQVRALNPRATISVDGHPQPKDTSRPLEGRDEVKWVNKGLIDLIFAMDYRERIDYEKIDKVRSELKDSNKLIVIFGNYDKKDGNAIPRSGNLVAKYADFAKRKWPSSGVAFYLYWQMSDAQILALKGGPFSESSLVNIQRR